MIYVGIPDAKKLYFQYQTVIILNPEPLNPGPWTLNLWINLSVNVCNCGLGVKREKKRQNEAIQQIFNNQ